MTPMPPPRDGDVHIHCRALPSHPSELSRLEHLLSPDETGRTALLKNDSAKKRYIAGRGVLREILGRYLGVEPGKVQIATGEHGKPYVAGSVNTIRFNLSHSGDLLVLAVSTGREVGIDIETIETDKPLKDMAKIAFSRREQAELLTLQSSHLLATAFYRCWVRKEACLKACGRGFSLLNDSFDVSCCTEEIPMLVRCNETYWHVLDLHVPQRYCAAVAVEARSPSLSPPHLVWVAQEA